MKLLFIAEQLKCGGAERHLVALATGMARRGHHVTVACLKQGSELDDQLEQGGVWRRVCCHARGGLDLQALERLVALLEVEHPGLLIASSQYALMFAALARLRSRPLAPLAFICHSMDVVQRGAAARLRFSVYRQFYRAATCIVFVSERQRAYFAARTALPGRVDVIHNGIDLFHYARPRRSAAHTLRAAFGFSPSDLVVGLCAAFREEKRQADLLAALALVRRQGLPYKALLVGEGAGRVRLEAARDRLGLQQCVRLAGFQHDVRPCIDLCDAMALTSHSETFPIATLEYMAFGKAIVASDVGGLREQLAHGQNGLLYQAGNVDALAAALALLADAGLRNRLGRAALRTVRARFDQSQMLARYESLFGALADGRQ